MNTSIHDNYFVGKAEFLLNNIFYKNNYFLNINKIKKQKIIF